MKFKIVSLNTWHGGEIFEPLMNFLERENADILHLQEVYQNPEHKYFKKPSFNCFEYIQEKFVYPFSAKSKEFFMDAEGEKIVIGNATFSRFEIVDQEVIQFRGHKTFDYNFYSTQKPVNFTEAPYNALLSNIKIGKEIITSINVHGVWGFDGYDNPRRLSMRDELKKYFDPQTPVILSGDFNTELKTETMQGLSKGLHNPFEGQLETTFNVIQKNHPGFEHSLVDHFFVSRHFKVLEAYQPQVDISDHLPLVATLEI